MLVVEHTERAVCDDYAVGGAEALFYPAGEVYALLDQDDRISAGFLGGLDLLQHIFGIAAGAVFHLLGIPLEAFGRVFRR